MKKSHIAGWVSDSPTPAQLAEFFRQCQGPDPRVTKDRLQRFLRGDNPLSGYGLAHEILGQDFITPEEVARAKGLVYTDDFLQQFENTLPSEDVLRYCRENGFVLVAGPPQSMNLLEIRNLKPEYFYSKSGGWFAEDRQRFSREDKVNPGWLALRKEPVSNSTSKNWDEQFQLLADAEQVPNAAEVVWGLTTYKAVRDIYLLPNVYVRTSSLGSGGLRVYVGHFDGAGLFLICNRWGDLRDGGLGLAASLKFQK